MNKRTKYQIGDLFLVPLEDGRFGVGKILKKDEATLFIELYKMKPLNESSGFDLKNVNMEETVLKIWCYDEGIRKGEWKVVGNKPVKLPVIMPEFWTESSDGKYYLIPGTDTYEGDEDRIREVK